MKTASALFFTACSTACVFFSFISPWWFSTLVPSLHGDYTYSFIDGTCRNGPRIYKDNLKAQHAYDWTLSLMLCSLVPLLCFIHFILIKRNRRYNFIVKPLHISLSGILTVFLLLAAVTVFASEISRGYGKPTLYGHKELEFPFRQRMSWGIHVVWYFAIVAMFLMLPAILLGIMMKDARMKSRTGRNEKDPLLAPIIIEERTRIETAARPIPETSRRSKEIIKEAM